MKKTTYIVLLVFTVSFLLASCGKKVPVRPPDNQILSQTH